MTDRAIARTIVRHMLHKLLTLLVPTKGKVLFVALIVLGVFSYTRVQAPTRVYAAVSDELNFQARLFDDSGNIVDDGAYTVAFNLYNAESGGSSIWNETHGSLVVKNGYFSVQLGSVATFPGTIDWSQEKWLTLNVESDGEMTPRIKLTATPYSFRSGQADTLTNGSGSLTAADFAQLAPTSTQAVNSALAALRINQTGAGLLADLQGDGSSVFTVSKTGFVTANSGIRIGNTTDTTAGNLRWTGTDFEGYDGTEWQSLTDGGGGGSGTAFVQGGNSFGSTAILGTTGSNGLNFITNSANRLTIDATGNINIVSGSLSTNGTQRLTNAGALRNITGLTIISGGANITGGINNNNGGITNAGALSGVTSITASGAISAGSFTGNGAGLTALNAGNISSGTLADGRLSSNVALLNGAQTFTGLTGFSAGATLGNTSDTTTGNIRWTGTDFEGYNGTEWKSFTLNPSPDPDVATFYDSAGGGAIGTGVYSTIAFNATLTNSDATNISLAANEVTVAESGYYEISYEVTATLANSTRSGFQAKLQRDTGGGYSDVAGSEAFHYGRITTETQGTSSATVVLNLSAGDKIRVQGQGTTANFTTVANASRITLVRVTNGGGSGGGGGGSGTAFEQNGNAFGSAAILGTTDNNPLNFITNSTTQFTIDTSGNVNIANGDIATNGTTRLTNSGALQNITGLTVISGGASFTGGIDNNSGGITEVGALSGVTSIVASGAVSAASFSGDGSGLTALNASNISTGTLADARLSSNVGLLDTTQTYTALDIFSAGLRLGNTANTTAGNIRWTGTDFEGYDGSEWKSFTSGGGAGLSFVQNGNSFGETAVFGTTDNFGLNFITNNTSQFTIDTSGNINVVNGNVSTGGTVRLTNAGVLQNITGLTLTSGNINVGGGNIINAGSVTATSFTGNGAGLTSLNASNITTGTLADGRLSANVALLNGTQTFTGTNTFSSGITIGNTAAPAAGRIRWTGADFEGYNGSAWVSLTSGGGLTGSGNVYSIIKPANEVVTSSTTFQNDDHFFVPIAANERWSFRFVLYANASTAGDAKFTVTAPSGATCSIGVVDTEGAVTTGNLGCGVSSGLIAGNGTTDTYEITGSVVNGATAGQVRLQWAQNTSSASGFTVFSGSYMTAIPENPSVGGGTPTNAFTQNGNNFGSTAILGTTDNNALSFITNTVSRLQIDTSGNINVTGGALQTNGTTRLTNAGALQNITGLTVISGGANISGGINNNSGGLTNTGSIAGATTINASGLITAAAGATISGATTNINNNSNNVTNINTGTSTGAINIGGGSSPLVINSTNFNVSATGALSGITTINASGGVTAGSFTGSGAGLTALNASNISTGTLADGRLSSNVALLNAIQTFTGTNTFSNVLTVSSGGLVISGGIDNNSGGITEAGAVSGVTGLTFISGNLNLAGGGIINTGNLSGVTGITFTSGSLNLANGGITNTGAIAGATTITGSGNFNTTGGAIQTNSISRITNSGGLTNITSYSQTGGNFGITGAGTFSTGTGQIDLNGAVNAATTIFVNDGLSITGTNGNVNSKFYVEGANTTPTIAGGDVTFGTYSFDADNDADEAAWTFVSDNGTNGLNPANTARAWSHDTDDTTSTDVGPTSGQGGSPDGYVYTEASAPGAFNDTFHMTLNQNLDASVYDWEIAFYWNQRGNDNTATVQVQTNENGGGWVTRDTFGDGDFGGPPDVATGGTQQWRLANVDLSSAISDANTQIRLLVTFPAAGTSWHNDFGIDTVTVTGTAPPPTYGDNLFEGYNNSAVSDVDLFVLRSDVGGSQNVKFRIDSDGDVFSDGVNNIGGGADVAENYKNSDGAKAGDVVVFSDSRTVKKSTTDGERGLAGVVSSYAGLVLDAKVKGVPVALSGRAPVKFNNINGPIEKGDYLTSGPNGTAVKAISAGPIIGTAMESATENGLVDLFVHLGYYVPGSSVNPAFAGAFASGGLNSTDSDTFIGNTEDTDEDGLTIAVNQQGQFSGSSLQITADETSNLVEFTKDDQNVFTVFNDGSLQLMADRANIFTVKNQAGDDHFSINTQGGLVRIGTAQADTSAVLFILDNVALDGDPVGVDGAQYYNTILNKFRCFENGIWQNCISSIDSEFTIVSSAFSLIPDQPGDELFSSEQTLVDLEGVKEFRILASVAELEAANAECRIQYALDGSSQWSDLGSAQMAITANGLARTGWSEPVRPAKTDVFVRVACNTTVVDQDVGTALVKNIRIQVR